ncbi:MAG: hypothetical protein ACI89X_003264 [Planctomycetota bacterium]|jgi:hypothetical protein
MKMTILLLSVLAAGIAAQDSKPAVAAGAQKPVVAEQDEWGEGFGRATSYRAALAQALEDAVAKAKGVEVARGPTIRSRLSVISEHKDGNKAGFFDGKSELEREWVQQQIKGFVRKYEVTKKGKAGDRMWEVTVRALVASLQAMEGELVIELIDNDLRSWQHERYEEDGPGRAFDRRKGKFEGPKIGEYLRRSGAVKIVSRGAGVKVNSQSERTEREKLGHQLVASHRVVINWQPLTVRSMVEKPNKARPTRGPRPEYMQGGSVKVSVKVENLIERTVMLEETFSVPGDKPGDYPADRLDAFITQLVDKAKASVAKKVYFTLRQPVVMRKWAGVGGKWLVEARISRRVAAGFKKFSIGNNGSLGNPDWQNLGSAKLVGGSGASCTFELVGVDDLPSVEAGVSEVRPVN